MTTTPAYLGDEALGKLLNSGGVSRSTDQVKAHVRGILAAPPRRDAAEWQDLIAPAGSDELRAQLSALHTVLGAERDDTGWSRARVEAIRARFDDHQIDGFIIPRADEHQNEYVPERAERLLWSTDFSGSAGCAIVMRDSAHIFVDGRYTLQVGEQVDTEIFEVHHLIEEPPTKWIAANLAEGTRFGIDPWVHTVNGAKALKKACGKAKATLVECAANPLDEAWDNQPPQPLAPVIPQPMKYSGQSAEDKRAAMLEAIGKDGAQALVLAGTDSVAWILNVRGGDVPHTPLVLGFVVLQQDATVDFCVDSRKLAPGLLDHLGPNVRVRDYEALGGLLDGLAGQAVHVDPTRTAAWVQTRLKAAGATVVAGDDPCMLPKARKNEVELNGTRAAHRRDGAALTSFLAWLEGAAANGELTEIDAANRLEQFRVELAEGFRDLSFDTISGSGPNGAIVHYRVTEESNRHLKPGELYLVDSGAQYPDGTTDVTRTVAIGEPTDEMRDRFTRVLKGHIQLGSARFAKGTTGSHLDALARMPLWQAGLDYDHGTGHGVGSYLGVHEGPQRISKGLSTVALEPGMILSNEPGYYKTNAYGIRVENLVVVNEEVLEGGEKPVLSFETLTLAPIDRHLVEPGLLTTEELAWLNAYHARVRDELADLVADDAKAWLTAATAPIS